MQKADIRRANVVEAPIYNDAGNGAPVFDSVGAHPVIRNPASSGHTVIKLEMLPVNDFEGCMVGNAAAFKNRLQRQLGTLYHEYSGHRKMPVHRHDDRISAPTANFACFGIPCQAMY